MSKPKFDERDRAKVISEIEQWFAVRLSKIDRYNKFLHDVAGRSFWVFGGYGSWHGFQEKAIPEGVATGSEGVLVIAKRDRAAIDIYSGPLQPLIESRHKLYRTRNGDYQFNVDAEGDCLYIKEVDGYKLQKLGTGAANSANRTTKQIRKKAGSVD